MESYQYHINTIVLSKTVLNRKFMSHGVSSQFSGSIVNMHILYRKMFILKNRKYMIMVIPKNLLGILAIILHSKENIKGVHMLDQFYIWNTILGYLIVPVDWCYCMGRNMHYHTLTSSEFYLIQCIRRYTLFDQTFV